MLRRLLPKSARLFFVAITCALSGCSGGDADLRQWVTQEKALPGPPIAPLPVLKTFETFEYHAQGGRDPFAPSAAEQQAAEVTGASPDPHPKEKLEDYPLDSLKMVGTIGTGAGTVGLVKDPDGTIDRVSLRNYMGQNNGKISAISANRIDLVELISNGNGGWVERSAAIELGTK